MAVDQGRAESLATRMAIADALAEMFGRPDETQEDIAAKITAAGTLGPVKQPKVSAWLRGARPLTLDQIAQLEEIYGRPRGWVLNCAGLVDAAGILRRLAVDHAESPQAARARRVLDRVTALLDDFETMFPVR